MVALAELARSVAARAERRSGRAGRRGRRRRPTAACTRQPQPLERAISNLVENASEVQPARHRRRGRRCTVADSKSATRSRHPGGRPASRVRPLLPFRRGAYRARIRPRARDRQADRRAPARHGLGSRPVRPAARRSGSSSRRCPRASSSPDLRPGRLPGGCDTVTRMTPIVQPGSTVLADVAASTSYAAPRRADGVRWSRRVSPEPTTRSGWWSPSSTTARRSNGTREHGDDGVYVMSGALDVEVRAHARARPTVRSIVESGARCAPRVRSGRRRIVHCGARDAAPPADGLYGAPAR